MFVRLKPCLYQYEILYWFMGIYSQRATSLLFEAEETDIFLQLHICEQQPKILFKHMIAVAQFFSLCCNIYCSIGYYSGVFISSVICLIFKMILSVLIFYLFLQSVLTLFLISIFICLIYELFCVWEIIYFDFKIYQ